MDAAIRTFDPRALLDHEAGSFLRRTQGRETFLAGPMPGFPDVCVVKRTLGPMRGERWYAALTPARRRAAGQQEHDNLVALAAEGIRVPRALAWCVDSPRSGPVRSAVVMERIVHAETLRDVLARAGASERRVLLAELLALVVRLHGSSWYHRDLYLQHVLVESTSGALVLIDVGRARREATPRERWFVKDLAALLHSAPTNVGVRERLRFLAGWLDARGIGDRRARRRVLRAVIEKCLRIAAHVPRDERATEAGA